MKYNFSVFIDKPKRVDMYLSALFGEFSRSYIQKLVDRGRVYINTKKINKNIRVKSFDEIILVIEVEKMEIEPQNIPLDIVYQDKDIIIVNKEPRLNVHPVPGEGGKKNTLVNALLYHLKDLASIGGVERPGIVHRLDKDTSGLIMVAKNDKMMKYLQNIIKGREIDKYYIAIVDGIIKNKKLKIESYIGRDPNSRIKMTVNNPINPKYSLTKAEVIDYIDDKYTVLKIKLETGRTHQIRVHLSSIGHPIIGDSVYGKKEINARVKAKYGLDRQALHAYELQFKLHNKIQKFIGELKGDMKKIIGKLKN